MDLHNHQEDNVCAGEVNGKQIRIRKEPNIFKAIYQGFSKFNAYCLAESMFVDSITGGHRLFPSCRRRIDDRIRMSDDFSFCLL